MNYLNIFVGVFCAYTWLPGAYCIVINVPVLLHSLCSCFFSLLLLSCVVFLRVHI